MQSALSIGSGNGGRSWVLGKLETDLGHRMLIELFVK